MAAGGALVAAAGAVLFAGRTVAAPQPTFFWVSPFQIGTTGGVMVAAAAYGLHARIEVFDDGLREVRPLWTNEEIQFEAVERALLPMKSGGLRLFTGSGGQLRMHIDESSFERFDRLALQVYRRLPDDAENDDPAGRLYAYHGGDDRPPNGARPED